MTVATLVEVRRESSCAATLRLELGEAPFPYRPGQYVKIEPRQFDALVPALREREAKRGRPDGPGYFSLSSDATEPRFLEITIKAALSNTVPLQHYLVEQARPGLKVELSEAAGKYCLPAAPPDGILGFLHVCAGSGAAPNRGMIRHALLRGWPQRHVLVVQDHSEADLLFRDEWRDLERRHADRLRVRPVLSTTTGHVTPVIVAEAMSGFIAPATSMAFLCGPNYVRDGAPGFMDAWKGWLKDPLGFDPARVIPSS